jgi:hypothetical protein
MRRFLAVVAIVLLTPTFSHALPAFPGAEGGGADTIGGRSGSAKLYKVNVLTDSGNPNTGSGSCTMYW